MHRLVFSHNDNNNNDFINNFRSDSIEDSNNNNNDTGNSIDLVLGDLTLGLICGTFQSKNLKQNHNLLFSVVQDTN